MRTNVSKGYLQLEAEGSTAPEVTKATSFERSVTRRPTVSSHYANNSIKVSFKSRARYKWRSVSDSDLNTINKFGKAIQISQPLYDFAKMAVLILMCKIKKP